MFVPPFSAAEIAETRTAIRSDFNTVTVPVFTGVSLDHDSTGAEVPQKAITGLLVAKAAEFTVSAVLEAVEIMCAHAELMQSPERLHARLAFKMAGCDISQYETRRVPHDEETFKNIVQTGPTPDAKAKLYRAYSVCWKAFKLLDFEIDQFRELKPDYMPSPEAARTLIEHAAILYEVAGDMLADARYEGGGEKLHLVSRALGNAAQEIVAGATFGKAFAEASRQLFKAPPLKLASPKEAGRDNLTPAAVLGGNRPL